MVSSQNTASETNTLKRKHEDDDDYDNLWGACALPSCSAVIHIESDGVYFWVVL